MKDYTRIKSFLKCSGFVTLYTLLFCTLSVFASEPIKEQNNLCTNEGCCVDYEGDILRFDSNDIITPRTINNILTDNYSSFNLFCNQSPNIKLQNQKDNKSNPYIYYGESYPKENEEIKKRIQDINKVEIEVKNIINEMNKSIKRELNNKQIKFNIKNINGSQLECDKSLSKEKKPSSKKDIINKKRNGYKYVRSKESRLKEQKRQIDRREQRIRIAQDYCKSNPELISNIKNCLKRNNLYLRKKLIGLMYFLSKDQSIPLTIYDRRNNICSYYWLAKNWKSFKNVIQEKRDIINLFIKQLGPI